MTTARTDVDLTANGLPTNAKIKERQRTHFVRNLALSDLPAPS